MQSLGWIVFQNLPKLRAHTFCVPAIAFPGLDLADMFTCFKKTYGLVIHYSNVSNSKSCKQGTRRLIK